MPCRLPTIRLQNALLSPANRLAYPMRRGHAQAKPHASSQLQRHQFSYRLGVSASPKAAALTEQAHLKNYWAQAYLQGPSWRPPFFSSVEDMSGEDAFFISHVGRSRRHVVLGLADGVGGWQDQGVNPAYFSRGLCAYMAEATIRPETERDLKPVTLLEKSYAQVLKDKAIVAGGSTACIATLDLNGQMEVGNLGDSGFMILQPGKIAFKFEPQTHEFNTPYQLSKLTPRMEAQRAIFGGAAQIAEQPSAADVSHHRLDHGNVVVLATDGLWDNLSAMEVLEIISGIMQDAGHWTGGSRSGSDAKESLVNGDSLRSASLEELPGQLAYAVMRAAKIASHDTRRDGPFAKEVHKAFPREAYSGGKVDDICVIVCIAVEDGSKKGTSKEGTSKKGTSSYKPKL